MKFSRCSLMCMFTYNTLIAIQLAQSRFNLIRLYALGSAAANVSNLRSPGSGMAETYSPHYKR